jgi:hypothetical protein
VHAVCVAVAAPALVKKPCAAGRHWRAPATLYLPAGHMLAAGDADDDPAGHA